MPCCAWAFICGGKVSVQQVAVDRFGNALGSSLADAMGQQNTAQQNAQARALVMVVCAPAIHHGGKLV